MKNNILKEQKRNCGYGYEGCFYYQDGECIYFKSDLQIEQGQACYEDKKRDRIECELDYLDGLWF